MALTVTGKANVGDLDASAYGYYDGEFSLFKYYDAEGNWLGNDPDLVDWDDELEADIYDGDPTKIIDWNNSRQEWGTQTAISGYTKLIVTVNTSGTKIASKASGESFVDASVLKIVPNLTVNGDIISEGGCLIEINRV